MQVVAQTAERHCLCSQIHFPDTTLQAKVANRCSQDHQLCKPASTSKILILKHAQKSSFADEYHEVAQNKQIKKVNSDAQLNLFIDDTTGLPRALGRLENSDLPESMKTQILLPQRHLVTRLALRPQLVIAVA